MTMPNDPTRLGPDYDPEQPERPEVYAYPHMEMDPETFGKAALLRSDILGMPNQDPFKPAPAEYTAQPNVEARLLDELLERLTRRRAQLEHNRREASKYGSSHSLSSAVGAQAEAVRLFDMVKKMKEALQ